MATTDVLLLAAHELELLAPRAGARETVAGVEVAAEAVGVGLVAAAAGTSHWLAALRPRAVVLLGSCGVYPGAAGPGLLELLVPSRVELLDGPSLEGRSGFPDPMQRSFDSDVALRDALVAQGTHQGTLGCTLAVSSDDGLARLLATSGCSGENLEAHAVAHACALHDTPFAAVMAVTNLVGQDGRRQWREHHVAAARKSCDHVARWLRGGAPGLPRDAPGART